MGVSRRGGLQGAAAMAPGEVALTEGAVMAEARQRGRLQCLFGCGSKRERELEKTGVS